MKFFVLGLGSIGIRHARNLLAMGHEVWGFDVDDAVMPRALEAGVRWGLIRENWPHIDAYVVCTPTVEHLGGLSHAVIHEKHVFVEKPIATPSCCEHIAVLLDEAKRKNLVVMVGNMLRFHPEVRRIKPLINKPKKAIFWVLQKNERYTEPVILNWGAHEIDLALYLFGAAAVSQVYMSDRRASIRLEHFHYPTTTINMDYLTEPEIRKFEIDQEGGTLEVDLRLPDWNKVYTDEMDSFITQIIAAKSGIPEILNSIRARTIGATGEDGLATLKLINAAQRMMADAS